MRITERSLLCARVCVCVLQLKADWSGRSRWPSIVKSGTSSTDWLFHRLRILRDNNLHSSSERNSNCVDIHLVVRYPTLERGY